jgi:hypothetical protein
MKSRSPGSLATDGSFLSPFIASTALCVSDALNVDRSIGVLFPRFLDSLFLCRRNSARPLRVAPSDGPITFWASVSQSQRQSLSESRIHAMVFDFQKLC